MKKLILAGIIFSLSVIPSFSIAYRYIEVKIYYPEFKYQRDFDVIKPFAIKFIDLFSNEKFISPLYSNFIPRQSNFETNAFPGLFTVILFIIGLGLFLLYILNNKRKTFYNLALPSYIAIILFGLGFFLASGANYFKAPFQFLMEQLPGLAGLRAIGRISIIIVLSECLVATMLLRIIHVHFSNTPYRKFGHYLIFSISLLQVAERIVPEYSDYKVDLKKEKKENAEIIQFLTTYQNPRGGGLLEIDMDGSEEFYYFLEKSLFHSLPIVNGYSGFMTNSHSVIMDMGKKLKKNEIPPQNDYLLSNTAILLIHSEHTPIPTEMESYLFKYFKTKKSISKYIIFMK